MGEGRGDGDVVRVACDSCAVEGDDLRVPKYEGSRRGKKEETYERCRVSCEVGGEDGGDQPRVPKGGHRILQLASPRAPPPQPGRTGWGMTGHSRMIDDVDALRRHAKERVTREELAASYAAEAGLVS